MLNPAYVFRPTQVVRRARRPKSGTTVVDLPWGMGLVVSVDEDMGSGLARSGVHELATTEVIWRLVDRQDETLDIGANVGYFTSLLAARSAHVQAFEPHPELRSVLERNVARWLTHNVTVDACAVSDHRGVARLTVPSSYASNNGTATLEDSSCPGSDHDAQREDGIGVVTDFEVDRVPLDDVIGDPIGLVKVDVEGHELAVLRGAERALTDRLIRDIVFEDHHIIDSGALIALRDSGYKIFGLAKGLRGVELVDPSSPRAVPRWEAPNYLATLDPHRAQRLMAPRGWRCLARGPLSSRRA